MWLRRQFWILLALSAAAVVIICVLLLGAHGPRLMGRDLLDKWSSDELTPGAKSQERFFPSANRQWTKNSTKVTLWTGQNVTNRRGQYLASLPAHSLPIGPAHSPSPGTADSAPPNQTPPVDPTPDPHHSKVRLLLLSYQRSGSSIISSLFGDDPNVFFTFEPLDALYSAMYGTGPGWNVPADITISPDGTSRRLPDTERAAIADFMMHLYDCDFQAMPSEFLVHPFWLTFRRWMSMAAPYVACLGSSGLTERRLLLVQHNLRSRCGQRLGDARSSQGRCFGHLWPSYADSSDRSVQHYLRGMKELRVKTRHCVDRYLTDVCRSTDFRVVKTVRGTMTSAADLLARDPDIKVIHLLRDPRGVTRSRMKASWSRGYYEGRDVRRTARAYCSTALADIQTYRTLNDRYPDRVHRVLLEDFLAAPEAGIREIYNFLNVTLPMKVISTFTDRLTPGFAEAWRQDKDLDTTVIRQACSGLFTELNIDPQNMSFVEHE